MGWKCAKTVLLAPERKCATSLYDCHCQKKSPESRQVLWEKKKFGSDLEVKNLTQEHKRDSQTSRIASHIWPSIFSRYEILDTLFLGGISAYPRSWEKEDPAASSLPSALNTEDLLYPRRLLCCYSAEQCRNSMTFLAIWEFLTTSMRQQRRCPLPSVTSGSSTFQEVFEAPASWFIFRFPHWHPLLTELDQI